MIFIAYRSSDLIGKNRFLPMKAHFLPINLANREITYYIYQNSSFVKFNLIIMNCPICNNENIGDNTSTCPECNSDLEAFTHINLIDKQLSARKKGMIVLVIALLIVTTGWAINYFNKDKVPTLDEGRKATVENKDQSEAIEQLTNSVEAKEQEIIELKSRIDELESNEGENGNTASEKGEEVSIGNEESSGTQIHVVQKNESLWKIAENLLGDGYKYIDLAEDNQINNPDLITEGQEIKINK